MTINAMCKDCAKYGKTCKGTECQTWSGCAMKETAEEKNHRIFEHYKKDLLLTAEISRPGELRYICIEYLCSFPGIDPVKMAATLQHEGVKIVFDNSAISAKANAAQRAQVAKAAAAM